MTLYQLTSGGKHHLLMHHDEEYTLLLSAQYFKELTSEMHQLMKAIHSQSSRKDVLLGNDAERAQEALDKMLKKQTTLPYKLNLSEEQEALITREGKWNIITHHSMI